MEKLFRASLFGGYNKNDVNNYIQELCLKTQEQTDDLEDENSDLKKEVEELRLKTKELTEKLEESSKNSLLVGEAILSAERKAKEIAEDAEKKAKFIVEQAVRDAEKRKEDLENELKLTQLKQRKLNEEIRQLKANVSLSVNKYQEKLDSLISED